MIKTAAAARLPWMLSGDLSGFPLHFHLRLYMISFVFTTAGHFWSSVKPSFHVYTNIIENSFFIYSSLLFPVIVLWSRVGKQIGLSESCWLQTAMLGNRKDQRITSPYLQRKHPDTRWLVFAFMPCGLKALCDRTVYWSDKGKWHGSLVQYFYTFYMFWA